MRKLIILAMISIAWVGGISATTYTSSQSGSWNNPATWSPNGIPNVGSNAPWPGDQVIIKHNVTYAGSLTYGVKAYLTIKSGGTLAISGDFNITSQGDLLVEAGGNLTCIDLTYTSQGTGFFNSAGTVQANQLSILNHSSYFILSGNSTFNFLSTNNGGGLIMNGGTLSVTDTDLRGGGKIVNNGGNFSVVNTLLLKQGFLIELDGDGTINTDKLDLIGGSAINGIGTGGVLTFNSVSMQNGTGVRCANNRCHYDPNGGPSGNIPPSPIDLETGTQVVLPVELVAFKGEADKNAITLTWITATESNNDYFEVQRSIDGQKFITLDRVDGTGYSTNRVSYRFEDQQPAQGLNYYRLMQVDFDGSKEYSLLISVSFSGQDEKGSIRVWPNPVVTDLYVEISVEADRSTLRLWNTMGQEIPINMQWDGKIGHLQIPGFLPSGLYFIQCGNQTYQLALK